MEETKKYQLPKKYSALDIIKAFQRAADFERNVNEKWISESLIGHGNRLFGAFTVFSMGARICCWFRRKKWFFFGQKIWIKDKGISFTLKPLILKQAYEEIEIHCEHRLVGYQIIFEKFIENFICRFLEKLEEKR